MTAHQKIATGLRFCPSCNEMTEPLVYSAADIPAELIGVITDARTGHAVDTFGYASGCRVNVPLGVALCACCEEPLPPVVNLPARLDAIAARRMG